MKLYTSVVFRPESGHEGISSLSKIIQGR